MSDMSKMGRHELEAELHKWRTGHQLGAIQEDLNAMQARAVEAEARVAVLSGVIDRVMALPDFWDDRRKQMGKDKSTCAAELRNALTCTRSMVGMSAQWRANAANHRKCQSTAMPGYAEGFHEGAGDIYVHCADELESVLKGKPCE